MASKPKATRSSARTKTAPQVADPAAPTRTTRAVSKAAAGVPTAVPAKKATARKPLVNRNTSPDPKPSSRSTTVKPPAVLKPTSTIVAEVPTDSDREPIKAFLRIRTRLDDSDAGYEPYLEPLSETSVRMTDPSSSTTHSRLSTISPSSLYTFSHVFPPETTQSDFFGKTTLPLVRDLLEGQSGLLFTYGVTNSGKTYTIQGGGSQGSAGILPRTLDVVFNSIEGLHGDSKYRPVRLQGVELASESDEPTSIRLANKAGAPALADVLEDDEPSSSTSSTDTDPTILKLDRNYEYTIWLSYSEVYNEKVYDLFGALDSGSSAAPSGIPRPTSAFLNMPLPSNKAPPLLLTRKALTVKPCPAKDGDGDAASAGKYIAGLRQVRVQSAAEAKELLRIGQLHRRVFGTLANSQSSRSHALVTIKVLRVHRGERNDPACIQTARLTLVDLAGSERTKHTHTSGERLREAGNINKSLMVLGQCMETLRVNQRAVARSLQQGVRPGTQLDTRDVKRGLALVPFRHSKLTEILMDYFVSEGGGRAVMIVNVNPYDTGFDENVHVMKFAALAREVTTNPAQAVSKVPPSPTKPKTGAGARPSAPQRRKVTISLGGPGRKASQAHLEVLEEDEELDDGEETSVEDDEPINPLVNALFDEVEELRMQLYDARLRCALIEAETREEVMVEMEERMRSMEDMFTRRLMRVMEHNEEKMDAKLDMIQQSRLLNRVAVPRSEGGYSDSIADSIDSDVGPLRMSDLGDGEYDDMASSVAGNEGDNESDDSEADAISDSDARDRTPSPLAGKGKGGPKRQSTLSSNEIRAPRVSEIVSEVDETETGDEIDTASPDEADDDDEEFVDDDIEEVSQPNLEEESEEEIQEWTESEASEATPARPTTKGKAAAKTVSSKPLATAQVNRAQEQAARGRRSTRTSKAVKELEQELDDLSLGDGDPEGSTLIIPNMKARAAAISAAGPGAVYVPQKGEVDGARKKKR
ncbi:kinesin-domain-containing protein [Ganoderma leucocontextum]|nr:kinesin-domain-containing protein [Ganoderma leucocontextum]